MIYIFEKEEEDEKEIAIFLDDYSLLYTMRVKVRVK